MLKVEDMAPAEMNAWPQRALPHKRHYGAIFEATGVLHLQ